MSGSGQSKGGVLTGMVRIACGRVSGLACFGGSPQSFLASLAPLLAFPIVGTAIGLFTEGPRQALTDLAVTLCAILTPAVLSYELARLWKREALWYRFATAFNWSQWILAIVAVLAMIPLGIVVSLGVKQNVVAAAFIVCLGLYGLWLYWFLARNALALSAVRAILFVLIVNAGTVAAVLVPGLFGQVRG
jgi:hypothetical protein